MTKNSLFLLMLCLGLSGCASFGRNLKAFLGGSDGSKPVESRSAGLERDQMSHVPTRQYGRITRSRLEEEAQLGSRAGSLWVPEGQGSYLFSENTARMTGDLLNIKLDGAPKDQLVTKAKVIGELLRKLEANKTPGKSADGGAQAADSGGAPAAAAPTPAPGAGGADEGGEDEKLINFDVVPTRVVERLNDGNYRVEGSQSFMIGKREYRVLVAGVVRAQDFNDEGVSASRVMDPHFDVVSAKKGSR